MKKFSIIFPGYGNYNFYEILQCYMKYKIFKKTFQEACTLLNKNLWKIAIYKEKKENQKYISVIIVTISIAIYRLWISKSKTYPKIMAGHSLGQYSALVCSKIISFKDVLNILMFRHNIINKATKKINTLMIVVIGIEFNKIKKLCKKLSYNSYSAYISHINSKKQIVISGNSKLILKIKKICENKYFAKTVILPIKICPHTPFIKKFSRKFFIFLKNIKFNKGNFFVVNNVNAYFFKNSKDIRYSLVEHLYKPVQWKKSIELIQKNVDMCIEIGPGNILTKINNFYYKFLSVPTDTLKNFLNSLKIK